MGIRLQYPRNRMFEEAWYACVDCDSSGTCRKYPESMTVEYEGKRYCREHFHWRFDRAFADEVRPEFPDERG